MMSAINKVNILDVFFDVVTLKEATDILIGFLDEKRNHVVVTPNPEIVMLAQKNQTFMSILNKADLVVADGIGIVWASKYSNARILERVSGYDLVLSFLEQANPFGCSVYFLGGAPTVVKAAVGNMSKRFSGLNFVGYHDGYFDNTDERMIVNELLSLKPDILLVGLGAPKQELWIDKYKSIIPARVCIGVGGSFDVMSGTVKRAPIFFQKLGLEWLHRLIKQPRRFFRMLRLPLFVFKVFFRHLKEERTNN